MPPIAILSLLLPVSVLVTSSSLPVEQVHEGVDRAEAACHDINSHPREDRCSFARDHCQNYTGGWVNVVTLHYCSLDDTPALSYGLQVGAVLFLFYMLGSTAEHFFSPALAVMSNRLGLSAHVAGVTLLAMGNGAPDLLSIFAAFLSGSSELALGEPLGAGIFATSVIVGAVVLTQTGVVEVSGSFIMDIVFYTLSLFWVCFMMGIKRVSWWSASILISLYIGYVVLVIMRGRRLKRMAAQPQAITVRMADIETVIRAERSDETAAEAAEDEQLEHEGDSRVVEQSPDETVCIQPVQMDSADEHSTRRGYNAPSDHRWGCPPCYALPWIVYRKIQNAADWHHRTRTAKITLFLAIPWFLLRECTLVVRKLTVPLVEDGEWHRWLVVANPLFSFPFLLIATRQITNDTIAIPVAIMGVVCSFLLFVTTESERPPRFFVVLVFWAFLVSVVWMYLIAQELVGLIKAMGLILHVDDSILGLTVLAWGNGLEDLVSNVVMARKGFPHMALAACYAGPALNLALGVGVSFLGVSISRFPGTYRVNLPWDVLVAFIYQFLTLVLTIYIVSSRRTIRRLPRWCAPLLLLLFAAFTATSIAVSYWME